MKFTSVFFAASAAASVLEARQGACRITASPGAPQFRPNAQRKYFLAATQTLRGNPNGDKAADAGHSHGGGGAPKLGGMGGMMGEGDSQSTRATITGAKLCGTCTVLAGQIKIFYPDGTPANVSNGIYTHHILTRGKSVSAFINLGMTGQAGASSQGFVGAGDDNGNRPWVYAPKTGSDFESGYHLTPSTSFNAEIVLVNYNKQAKTVCIAYDLEYLPGNVGKSVKSLLISSAGIKGPKTDRSRAVNTTGSPMAFKESGHIVTAKGHLHDGGSAMYMRISGKNSYSCVSKATYGGTMHNSNTKTISDMSDCNSKPWKVGAGDTMTLTAEYDLKSHPLRGTTGGGEGGVMGMFRVIFAPDKAW